MFFFTGRVLFTGKKKTGSNAFSCGQQRGEKAFPTLKNGDCLFREDFLDFTIPFTGMSDRPDGGGDFGTRTGTSGRANLADPEGQQIRGRSLDSSSLGGG